MDPRDRRRIALALAVTLLALPALWLMNRDGSSGAPNVAAVGVQVENGYLTDEAPDAVDTPTTGPSEPNLPTVEPLDDAAPVFMDGPSSDAAGVPEIAVPAPPRREVIEIEASYSSAIWGWTCIVPGIPTGTELTITNVNNNRSVTCTATFASAEHGDELILHTDSFLELADLTDAPIPVEINQ